MRMTDPDEKKSILGPVGEQVVQNVEELRKIRGLSLRALAAALGELGRPIGPNQLHALSQGARRVDADDLVALAIALGVNPNALLFDRHAVAGQVLMLTEEIDQRAGVSWAWADGEMPLPTQLVAEGTPGLPVDGPEVFDFLEHSRPVARRRDHPAARAVDQLNGRLSLAVAARDPETGRFKDAATREWWRGYVDKAMQRLRIELEELFDAPPPEVP
jgi:transcriptional regulator with XRE-family HTH domain